MKINILTVILLAVISTGSDLNPLLFWDQFRDFLNNHPGLHMGVWLISATLLYIIYLDTESKQSKVNPAGGS